MHLLCYYYLCGIKKRIKINTYIWAMSNSLYIKFLMRRLIKFLEQQQQKEAQKLIQEIMKELDN